MSGISKAGLKAGHLMAVCKCVHGTAAVQYGERQRPEHRSWDL